MSTSNPKPAFVPLVDLRAQLSGIHDDVRQALERALVRCDYILGEDVIEFEKEFAAFCNARFAVGCASGTDAIYLALRALGIGVGDEVIIPAMTFFATGLAVSLTGATPVLVDVVPDTALIDPTRIKAAITPRTRAIIPVHLYGQCADMTSIGAIAETHKLRIVEDAAQAHGATWQGRPAGSLGDVGCFSFYPGKNLGAYGDGGLITINDEALAERLRLLRNWGSQRKYHHEDIGLNSRLDTMQAAILRVKLRHLPAWNEARRRHAKNYDQALGACPGLVFTHYNSGCVYHLYVVRVSHRDRVLAALNKAGIGAGIHYPFAIHELNAYRKLGHETGSFPVSESWARQCLSLPLYPELPEDVPARAADIIREELQRS